MPVVGVAPGRGEGVLGAGDASFEVGALGVGVGFLLSFEGVQSRLGGLLGGLL
jgi:hypothetical protein